MKTINEVREEMVELEAVQWREVNEEVKTHFKPKKGIHPFEWVLIGIMGVMSGLVLLEILERLLWLLK